MVVDVAPAQQLKAVERARSRQLVGKYQYLVPLGVASAAAEGDVHQQGSARTQLDVLHRERKGRKQQHQRDSHAVA